MRTRTLLVLLLIGCLTLRAGTVVDPPGGLRFSFEIHPGKGGWIECQLNAKGFFIARQDGKSYTGALPAQESLRIMEAFEKICVAAGEDRFSLKPGIRIRPVFPYFHYESPRGKMLAMEGRENRPPPELVEFMITLSQKLIDHSSKQGSQAAKPAPPTRTF